MMHIGNARMSKRITNNKKYCICKLSDKMSDGTKADMGEECASYIVEYRFHEKCIIKWWDDISRANKF